MSTSANVTEFTIRLKSTGKQVGQHRQNWMCKTNWGKLLEFHPIENYSIQAYGYDEEDELWENDVEDLYDFLVRVGKIQLK